MALTEELRSALKGDVADDAATLKTYSRDTSIFERTPSVVVFPKDTEDVQNLVKTVRAHKEQGEDVSIAGRAAGTDMSGGPLTNSVVAAFTKYMNTVSEVGDGYAVTEPGAFYRDFEKATLAKGYLLPSYPASRSLAAMGGLLNNDSGGERTLKYGKTSRYVEEVDVVLSDGSTAHFGELGPDELARKKEEQTLEGEIYRRMSNLILDNRETIEGARPKVSKNSAGYALWDVFDMERGTFNLAKLICGSQGTLALTTKMKLSLIKPKEHRAMLVIFLKDINQLPEIVRIVLGENPESFESYDGHTFSLAIRFLPQMLMHMGPLRALRLGLSFLPDMLTALTGGVPKLILMAEFAEDTIKEADKKVIQTRNALKHLKIPMQIEWNEKWSEKYWTVRRESFALLRKNLSGLVAAPFIDDFVVPPETYPEFLPKLDELLTQYSDRFIYTVAGHIGNGNFHIIPLMDLKKPEVRAVVEELSPKVYELVVRYGGSTTGEHNDGIIRTPYLPLLFGEDMVRLFEETKKIFDPLNIFNPGKKVGGTFADVKSSMLKA